MTQTVNPRLELFFLFCVLVSVIGLLTAAVLSALRRRGAAKRWLKALEVGWAAYLSIVLVVAAATPQRVIPGHDCLDRRPGGRPSPRPERVAADLLSLVPERESIEDVGQTLLPDVGACCQRSTVFPGDCERV
jgi:hypothetical protein